VEAAGKLHRIFKAGDILPLLESSKITAKPDQKHCQKMSTTSTMVMQHKELSECLTHYFNPLNTTKRSY
ncbi:hypothetical protein L0244_21860, partial [bacterium]|nr:hypothetical protein [bacterium]